MAILNNSNAISTAGGYDINNSLRFRASASAYLNRTPSSGGNLRTWTASFWYKNGAIDSNQTLFSNATSSDSIGFRSSRTIEVYFGAGSANLVTTQVFRDTAAWYHIVVAVDTTQATAANRIKLYVNGSQVTAFSTATYPSQNYDTSFNKISTAQEIGRRASASDLFLDGYMAEVNWIDGQALTPSSFGETDTTTGVWKPKAYTGTYGTNGFYLPFRLNSSSGFSSYYGSFNGTTQSLSATLPSTLSGQFTIEGFIRPNVVTFNPLFTLGDASTSTGLEFYFGGGSTPTIYSDNGSQIADSYNIPATVWAHIAVTRDASNVIRLFINGTQVGGTYTSAAAFSNTLRIGAEFYSGSITGRMNGFISNFRIVTGSALYTSTFTPPSSALTAVSGTQLLTLQNSTIIDNSTNALTITNTGSVATTSATVGNYISDVGYEYSGNRNTWTTNNINYTAAGTTYDAMTDVPTNTSATVANYAVMNPLNAISITGGNTTTLSNANLSVLMPNTAGSRTAFATMGVSSGKWYWEATITTGSINTYYPGLGIDTNLNALPTDQSGGTTSGYVYLSNGQKLNNAALSTYGSSFTTNDVIGVALDMDAGTITFYKNNTSQGQAFSGITGTAVPCVIGQNNAALAINFGQRPFAYTPPTGFVRLNTYNLPDSTIKKGNTVMDATLYTGTGASQTIVNAGAFKPDFVWVKSRSNITNNSVYDSVRGFNASPGSPALFTNLTDAEGSSTNTVSSANSNGFTIAGSSNNLNTNAYTYVGWQWQAGQGSTSSNTSGSITSTVSVNTTAGFSIVTYTGNGTNGASIGHGLGVSPKLYIIKSRNSASGVWWVSGYPSFGAPFSANNNYLQLDQTNAIGSAATVGTTSSSSTITFNNSGVSVNANTTTYVAYCWAEIAGFSKFTSYTGNGSTDGPFIFLGFRPKFVMTKRTDTTSDWIIYDTSRNTYNVTDLRLFPNLSNAETQAGAMDLLSNGFKLRDTGASQNASGGTYIVMAFAESPFRNSLAR